MPRPNAASKVLLVADRRTATTHSPSVAVRRYRIARLRLESRSTDAGARFEHLKRVYD